ncbi:uncharacterized protein LOC122054926 [Zingiber officinale]|uniref:uncharacterized protein LOC122054926 n=1 Tax=Zingiber officinale TaxID=94328 RepID=UPI001C4CF52D|nr:uncharacterized protein LOC122054926 [Zingiber officinale]
MEEARKLNIITISQEDLDQLIQTKAQKIFQQPQAKTGEHSSIPLWNKEVERNFPKNSLEQRQVDDLPLGEINEVYLLDFIGSSGFIGELYPKVESVIILDHHKTVVEALCGNASFGKNVIKVIDMDKSGATIAFDFFKEKLLKRSDTLKGLGIHNHQEAGQKNLSGCKFERVQKLFEYIEDGDI